MKQNAEILQVFELAGDLPGPHVVLLAGVHGDEYEPITACLQLFQDLKNTIRKGSISFVPCTNRSAFEAGSRFGEDGLDLARVCPGKSDGSITERIAHAVSNLIRRADYLIDMHTGGITYSIFPLAGYILHANPEILNIQRQMALSIGLPLVWGTEPTPEGRTLSVARDAGIPSIYLEFGGDTGFRLQVVESYKSGFLNLLRLLGMIDGEYQKPAFEKTFWVEDNRSGSGFLQGMMPAPANGIFIREVSLGSQIDEKQNWGKITEPITGEETAISTDTAGLVFLVRNMVKVKQGDALGGVLPISQPGYIAIDEKGNTTTNKPDGYHISLTHQKEIKN